MGVGERREGELFNMLKLDGWGGGGGGETRAWGEGDTWAWGEGETRALGEGGGGGGNPSAPLSPSVYIPDNKFVVTVLT